MARILVEDDQPEVAELVLTVPVERMPIVSPATRHTLGQRRLFPARGHQPTAPRIVMVCWVPGTFSPGGSFSTLSAAQRDKTL